MSIWLLLESKSQNLLRWALRPRLTKAPNRSAIMRCLSSLFSFPGMRSGAPVFNFFLQSRRLLGYVRNVSSSIVELSSLYIF
jgi:hypothetical protein